MKIFARTITVALAMLMPLSAVAMPDFMKQNIGSLDCGINEIAKFDGSAWQCSSDLDALAQAIEGVGDLGCSATQQNNSVLITCGDGTAGAIAGAGTVVIYPEGQIGQVPPIDYNTGPIVAMDATGVILGKAIGIYPEGPVVRIVIELDARHSGTLINADSTQEVIFSASGPALYFLSDDCSGPAFGADTVSVWDVNHRFFIAGPAEAEQLLFKSSLNPGRWEVSEGVPYYIEPSECHTADFIATGSPVVEYFLAPEIANAVYPVRVEQLP